MYECILFRLKNVFMVIYVINKYKGKFLKNIYNFIIQKILFLKRVDCKNE